MKQPVAYVAFALAATACNGTGSSPNALPVDAPHSAIARATAGLGPIVQSAFGGAIYGWDIDQNGNDGLLTETAFGSHGTVINATETFDQSSGKIIKVVRKEVRTNPDSEPVLLGIAGSDVGVVDVEHTVVKNNTIQREDHFALLNPVTKNKITGHSRPPRRFGVVPSYMSDDQDSSPQIMTGFAFKRNAATRGVFYLYDTAHNTWSKRFDFPLSHLFPDTTLLYSAVDASTNEGVVGFLKRASYSQRESPTFEVLDTSSGRQLRSFQGLGYGFIDGMAIDPTTDMLCTTTLGDIDVEFYHLASGKGKAVQIPTLYSNGGGLISGGSVAADPVHHLFLIAQRNSTVSPNGGSSVLVYDEKGKLVEYINGFNFLNYTSVVVPRVAVNPANRTGYVDGPGSNELQEFTY